MGCVIASVSLSLTLCLTHVDSTCIMFKSKCLQKMGISQNTVNDKLYYNVQVYCLTCCDAYYIVFAGFCERCRHNIVVLNSIDNDVLLK